MSIRQLERPPTPIMSATNANLNVASRTSPKGARRQPSSASLSHVSTTPTVSGPYDPAAVDGESGGAASLAAAVAATMAPVSVSTAAFLARWDKLLPTQNTADTPPSSLAAPSHSLPVAQPSPESPKSSRRSANGRRGRRSGAGSSPTRKQVSLASAPPPQPITTKSTPIDHVSLANDLRNIAPLLLDSRSFPMPSPTSSSPSFSLSPDTLAQLLIHLTTTIPAIPVDSNIPRLATHALGNLFSKHAARIPDTTSLSAVTHVRDRVVQAIQAIQTENPKAPPQEARRVVSAGFRALHLIIHHTTLGLADDQLTPLVDAIHWAVFRAKHNPWLAAATFKVPQIHPQSTPMARAAVLRLSSTHRTSTSPSAAPSIHTRLSPSESETSDSDAATLGGGPREPAAKLRHSALTLLATLAARFGKPMFQHWEKFVARDLLLGTLTGDPSTRTRALAAQALGALVDGGRAYLGATGTVQVWASAGLGTAGGEGAKGGSAAFTSLSQRLARMVGEVHLRLVDALRVDGVNVAEAVQLVKTFATVAVAANYRTHHADAWTSFVQTMLATAKAHPDRTVTATAIQAVADALAATPSASSRTPAPSASSHSDKDPLVATAADWIDFAIALDPPPASLWPVIRHLLRSPLLDPSHLPTLLPVARAHAAELAEAILASPATHALYPPGDPWWPRAVDSLVLPLLMADANGATDEGTLGVSAGLDAAAALPADVFGKLARRQRIAILSLVVAKATTAEAEEPGDVEGQLGGDVDDPVGGVECAGVRAAACRAVGVFCGFPDLANDDQFLTDAISSLLSSATHTSLSVRIRVSWSLANLAHALHTYPASTLPSDLARHLHPLTLAALHFAARDHDKCRGNGIRALGPLYATLLSANPGRQPMSSLHADVVGVLVKAVGSSQGAVKARWNACYAAGKVLAEMCKRDGMGRVNEVVGALVGAVERAKNFKVRILATQALAGAGRVDGDVAARVVAAVEKVVESEGAGGNAMTGYVVEWVEALGALVETVDEGEVRGDLLERVERVREQVMGS